MKKLSNIISEILIEFSHSLTYAIIEVAWLVLNHLGDRGLLLSFGCRNILCLYYFFQSFRIKCENLPENVPTPLDAMLSFFGEHLECTVGNLVLFSWVILVTVVFCFSRYNHLNVSFGSQCSALEQRLRINNTSGINIDSGFNIVKSVGNNCL